MRWRASARACAYGEIAAVITAAPCLTNSDATKRNATDVDVAILAAEAQTLREMRPDLVAVEHFDATASSGSSPGLSCSLDLVDLFRPRTDR